MDQYFSGELSKLMRKLSDLFEHLKQPRKPSREEIAMHVFANSKHVNYDAVMSAQLAVAAADILMNELSK